MFTFEVVKCRLHQEEQRALEPESHPSDYRSSALVAVNGANSGEFTKCENKLAIVQCNNCGNFGDNQSHCRGKKVDSRWSTRPELADQKARKSIAFVGQHNVENETVIFEKDFVCLVSKLCESNPTSQKRDQQG